MNLKKLIKLSLIIFLIQAFFAFIMLFVFISMVNQVISLPEKAVSEATDQIKLWIFGKDPDLLQIDFQKIADKWIENYKWEDPKTGSQITGLNEDIVAIMRQEELLIPPELLISITSLKGKSDTNWIEGIAKKLEPKNLKFMESNGEVLLTEIQTYLGIYQLSYSGKDIKKVSFQENSEILDALLQELRLKKDKELILSITKSFDPGNQSIPDQGSVEIVGSYFSWPLDKKYRISSHFGKRFHPVDKTWKLHAGTDIAVPQGTKVYAAADGIIQKSTFSKAAGNYINIKHDNGYVTRYLHLIRRNSKVGERVKKGDLIGYSGNTGKSTGPHLHFEIRNPAGDPEDPEKYLPKIY